MPADWYHLGNALLDLSLAGLATGPVDRVWYSADGGTLFLATANGRIFETSDFDSWRASGPGTGIPLRQESAAGARRLPERGARIRTQIGQGSSIYAFGKFAYRSVDGGANWDNLTGFRSQSMVGPELRDLAVSPRNPDEVVVAGTAGVFRSLDGGKSWSGLNQGLPNLPAARLRGLPAGGHGVQLEFSMSGALGVLEWQPGEKQAWRPADAAASLASLRLRLAYSLDRGGPVTAISPLGGNVIYTGMADGRIIVSNDGGISWPVTFATGGGVVESFWVDPQDARIAVAVLGGVGPHVMRTENAGIFWDDLKLPNVAAHGVTASRGVPPGPGAVYVATDRGVFYTRVDLNALSPAGPWQPLAGLPEGVVTDVQLDAAENQIWAVVEGFGVYSTLAPHRLGDPKVVSAADMVARAAAPGALMSIAGARVAAAKAGDMTVPVLHAGDAESQIQIPFEARGSSLSLSIDSAAGQRVLAPLPLAAASPAIFVDRDGAPFLLDAVSGTMLDGANPAHAHSRIQILATGLGRVNPDWPTGMNAPFDNPPRVAGAVRVWLDRSPVETVRATLAPGYTGFYLVEIEVPAIVNTGAAELYLDVDGRPSNPVRVYIEP